MIHVFLVSLVFKTLVNCEAAKILAIFPTPSISHQIVFRPLTLGLASRGHEVTVITTDPAFPKGQAPPNLTEIDVHDISYTTWQYELRRVSVGDKTDMVAQLEMFTNLVAKIFQEQALNKEVQDQLKIKSHFDLILAEACVRPALIYSHIYRAPVIQVSSTGTIVGTNEIIGTPNHPILYPSIFSQRLYNLSFWEKIITIYEQVSFERMYMSKEEEENIMLRKIFGPDIPTLNELKKNVHMVFLNVHPIWYENQPMPPSVVFMGGLHQKPEKELPQGLASRGHEVTVITTDPAFPKGQAPPNLTEIDVHDISYTTWQHELRRVSVGDKIDMVAQLEMFVNLQAKIFQEQILNKEVQDQLKIKRHFDLILAEAFSRPALIYSHIYKAPVIQVSSAGTIMGTNEIIGTPNHPILYPSTFSVRLYNLSLWEKIITVYEQVSFERMHMSKEEEENIMLRKIFGPDIPTLSELKKNVHMVFLNVHPIWCDNQPMPPSVVFMGGLHQKLEKELPQELKTYLDSSKHGVIYVSFGTNVHPSILPTHNVKIMMTVFSELPYDVLLKWNTDLSDKPKNVKVMNWLPQADLLRHPKLKLFVTQGGLQSTDEAITAGVPLIGIPIIADQWYNTEKYVRHGIGMQLRINTFTEDDFKKAVLTVIENESYKNNIIKLRRIILDQPQTPLERAIWWTEHALRHGGTQHLRPPAANMPWTQYYEVELVLILLTIFTVILISLVVAISNIQRYLFRLFYSAVKIKKT